MFADTAKILIKSGDGGDGAVSFRRELYVPNGGPDGGDGGRGGDLVFEISDGLNNLNDFRLRKKFIAENGSPGRSKHSHGKDGSDLVVRVPEGTLIMDALTEKVIADMSGENRRLILLTGGRGGRGNQHFATSSMQAPRYAEPGEKGRRLEVLLELKLIADVGLVGMPNVGKSSLLAKVSNARPEVANYHFTTLTPHQGIVYVDPDESFVMADIPGLIEGASHGAGLGLMFLRHIERARILLHVVDAAGTEGRDPLRDISSINEELMKYSSALLSDRPMIIAANKIDRLSPDEREDILGRLFEAFSKDGIGIFPVSALTGEGIPELLEEISKLLKNSASKSIYYESEYDPKEAVSDPDTENIRVCRESPHTFVAEGAKIDRMLGYTNLDTEKGFHFFQRFMEDEGVIRRMKDLGLNEGDTVKIGGAEFTYYE